MNKKKKGFTLIELLAIIVILAIIAVITVPIILNVIDNARKGAAKDSAYGLISAAEYYYANYVLEDENGYLFDGATNILPYINVSGEKPDKGKIYMNDKGEVALAVVYGDYCITKYFNTDLYESTDVENCGVNNDFKVPSSYVAFGGEYKDTFSEVLKTSDGGFVAIGYSNSENYHGLKSHGTNMNNDAIIVKYDSQGNIMWNKNFGGSSSDSFNRVIEEEDSYTVVGTTLSKDEDLEGISEEQAIIVVKYDKNNGNVKYKKALFTNNKVNNQYEIRKIIKHENNYYAIVTGRNINSGSSLCYVVKYDLNFNEIWRNQYSDNYLSFTKQMIKTNNNTLLFNVIGYQNNGEMTGIYIEGARTFSAIFEISMEDGSIISKTSIGGNNETNIHDIIEVEDGYLCIGKSNATTGVFSNNKGNFDAFIAKIGKTPDENGILPTLWVKTYGGNNNDEFSSVVYNNNEIVISAFTRSTTDEFEGYNTSDVITTALLLKSDPNGNIIKKQKIGGSNYDYINDIIINGNNYVIAGTSFSTDGDMQSFNYGNSDAFLMNVDSNLNPVMSFELKPVLANNIPELVKNYGTEIPTIENQSNLKLYTTINPTKDLGNWCGTGTILDPNRNYDWITCLEPLNSTDIFTLFTTSGVAIGTSNTYTLNPNPNDWIRFKFGFGNAGSKIELSNFKLKFEGDDFISIKEAVDKGYIEPLVLTGLNSTFSYFYPNSYNLIYGEGTGLEKYSSVFILIKPKNKVLEQFTIDASQVIPTSAGSITVSQMKNYDISLSPAQ